MKVLWASRRLLRADPASGIIAWGSCSQLAAKSLDSTLKLESAAEIIPERHDESSKAIVDTAPHDATAAFPHGCLSSSAQHYHNRGLSGVRQNSAASQQLRHLWSAHLRSKTPSDMSIQPAHLCSQNWATSGLPPCIRGLSTETIQDRVSQANSILQVSHICHKLKHCLRHTGPALDLEHCRDTVPASLASTAGTNRLVSDAGLSLGHSMILATGLVCCCSYT